MSFIYCHESPRIGRWYYREVPGFRDGLPGTSSGFVRDKDEAYRFATKEEAWAHCRVRRKGGHWGGGKWIVIRLRSPQAIPQGNEAKEK